MAKYSELVALLEWADKKKAPLTTEKPKVKNQFKEFMKLQKELDEFNKWKKDEEKKNEKKPEAEGLLKDWTVTQKTLLGIFLGPPVGLAYVKMLGTMAAQLH